MLLYHKYYYGVPFIMTRPSLGIKRIASKLVFTNPLKKEFAK